ncbi:hypothetical protein GRF29_112g225491, partial [Pseudopithomyces chartarum]
MQMWQGIQVKAYSARGIPTTTLPYSNPPPQPHRLPKHLPTPLPNVPPQLLPPNPPSFHLQSNPRIHRPPL